MKMKHWFFGLAFALASPSAFAGGPVTHLPTSAQLQGALHTVNTAQALLNKGSYLKATARIEQVNYTLEDVARRLHVAAPFPVAVSADLMTLRQDLLQKKVVKGTKGVLDKVLAKERNWIGQHEKK